MLNVILKSWNQYIC